MNGLRVASCELRVAGGVLRVASYELRGTGKKGKWHSA
jgi:hypothetical protein